MTVPPFLQAPTCKWYFYMLGSFSVFVGFCLLTFSFFILFIQFSNLLLRE